MAICIRKIKERLDEYDSKYEEWVKSHPEEAVQQKAYEERERILDEYWNEYWYQLSLEENDFEGI
jgi:hypothetical protein